MNRLTRNRLLYAFVLFIALALTWMYGGRMLYVTLYTLILLPVVSYVLTFVLLRGLVVTQQADQNTLVKEEPGSYTVTIRNRTPLLYSPVECLFADDHFAVEVEHTMHALFVRPFMKEQYKITYRVKYRGEYRMGIRALRVTDMTGLFTLKKTLKDTVSLTVLPRVLEMSYFPLAMNLLSQAHSNYEIREEDYATISDIRRYEPTDSIKRVHWKLTAKRNEWMVKNYQSNALNRITVMIDNLRTPGAYEDNLALEDRMIETVLAVIYYCLRRAMPVELIAGEGVNKEGRNQSDFDALYRMAAGLVYEDASSQLENRALTLLEKCLNASASYINVVIATSKLDAALYDRIISANHYGHYIALLYFVGAGSDAASDEIFRMLTDGGASCYRITENTKLTEVA